MRSLLMTAPLQALFFTLLILAIGAGGCSLQKEKLDERGENQEVYKLTGLAQPEAARDPLFDALSPLQVESSLRRVIVRPSDWMSIIKKDPAPFFSTDQRTWIKNILIEQMPTLQPNQQLEFVFRDQFKDFLVELRMYPDGEFLVYRFLALAANPSRARKFGDPKPLNYAEIKPLSGQIYSDARNAWVLKDPIRLDVLASSKIMDQKLALARKAFKQSVIKDAELKEMENTIRDKPEISLDVWRVFWEKRTTLYNARNQGLFTEEEFQDRHRKLMGELKSS